MCSSRFFYGDVWVAPALHSSPPFHQVQYSNQRWQQRSDQLIAALEIAGELSPGKRPIELYVKPEIHTHSHPPSSPLLRLLLILIIISITMVGGCSSSCCRGRRRRRRRRRRRSSSSSSSSSSSRLQYSSAHLPMETQCFEVMPKHSYTLPGPT